MATADQGEQGNWRAQFLTVLREEFAKARKQNPEFSLRRFAKQLGVSPGPASELLNGTRDWKFSPDWAQRVLERLNPAAEVRDELLMRMGRRPEVVNQELPESDYDTLGDWTVFPILMSYELPAPHNTTAEIARRLGLTEAKVEVVTADLLQRGWLVREEDGRIARPKTFLQTPDNVSIASVRRFHTENLRQAEKALDNVPLEERDFQALTLVGCRQDIAAIKREIRELLEKASVVMNRGDRNNEVFRLSVQLYPVAQATSADAT